VSVPGCRALGWHALSNSAWTLAVTLPARQHCHIIIQQSYKQSHRSCDIYSLARCGPWKLRNVAFVVLDLVSSVLAQLSAGKSCLQNDLLCVNYHDWINPVPDRSINGQWKDDESWTLSTGVRKGMCTYSNKASCKLRNLSHKFLDKSASCTSELVPEKNINVQFFHSKLISR